MTVDKMDPQAVTREAEELGLNDKACWRRSLRSWKA